MKNTLKFFIWKICKGGNHTSSLQVKYFGIPSKGSNRVVHTVKNLHKLRLLCSVQKFMSAQRPLCNANTHESYTLACGEQIWVCAKPFWIRSIQVFQFVYLWYIPPFYLPTIITFPLCRNSLCHRGTCDEKF